MFVQIFINFVSDASSGVAEVKLDASALINGGAAGNKTYVDVINRLTAAGALVVCVCAKLHTNHGLLFKSK